MYTVKLTEQQLQNLLSFLNRVQLTGQEAVAFVSILQALNNSTSNSIREDEE